MIYRSVGHLRYSFTEDYGHKLIVEVDQELANFYRSLIPRWFDVNPQKFPAHISVIRHETPIKLEYWGKYEGEEITFVYDPFVYVGNVYYWFNAFATRLEEIRVELGLSNSSRFSRPPDGRRCFHVTIGNSKKPN